MEAFVHTNSCTQKCIAALFVKAKLGNNSDIPQYVEKRSNCDIAVPQWNTTVQSKGVNCCYSHLDESPENYAE